MQITLSPLLVVLATSGAAVCCCLVTLLCVCRIRSLRKEALNPAAKRERANATEDPGEFGRSLQKADESAHPQKTHSQGQSSHTRSGSFFKRPVIKELFKDYKYPKSEPTLTDRTGGGNLSVPSELNHLQPAPRVSSFDIELATRESLIRDESLTNSTMNSDDRSSSSSQSSSSFDGLSQADDEDDEDHDLSDPLTDDDEGEHDDLMEGVLSDHKSSSDYDDGPKAWASDFTLSTVGTNLRSQNVTVLRWGSNSTANTQCSGRSSTATEGSTPLTNVTSLTGSTLDSLDLERESVQRER